MNVPLRAVLYAGPLAVALVAPGIARAQAVPTPAGPARTASISGVVYDSLAMRPLADAVVQLAQVPAGGRLGTMRTTRSDSGGQYRFDAVATGTYLLGFQHVAVDSLGMRGSVTRVDLRTPTPLRVGLAIPSPSTIIAGVCGRASLADSIALLVGSVRDARTDASLAGSYVSLRWGEMYLSRQGLRRDTPILDLFANDEGWFAACVPGATPILSRATHDDDASGDVEIAVPVLAILRRDLYVGYVEATIVGDDSTRRAGAPNAGERIVTRGRGTVRGLVRGTDGRPLAAARVALLSGASETRTDPQGRFVLTGVPQGTQTVEARALGYLPAQEIVDIVTFRDASAEFSLIDTRAFLLDTVRVAAVRQLDAAARAGFDRRRRGGTGFFLDEAQIDSIRAFSFRDLVRSIPGIRFVRPNRPDQNYREHIEMTAGRSYPCLPVIYLDGILLLADATDLDLMVNPSLVRRVEVYHRGITPPPEFASVKECGVIAVWTGAPKSAIVRPSK